MTHVAMLLATLTPGHVGGSETYARGLLAAYAAGHGPAITTVLAHARTADSLDGLAAAPPGEGESGSSGSGPRALRLRPLRGAADVSDGGSGPGALRLRTLRGSGPAADGARRAAWLVAALANARPLRDVAADVVHAPLTIPVPRVDAPLVVTLHDVAHHEHPSSFSAAERAFRRLAYDRAARAAAVVITDSEHARGAIVRRLRIPGERVVAIHHGIDHERFHPRPDRADARRLASLRLADPFVVYPANLWPHKNHERLLEGMAAGGEREYTLVLTGQPSARLASLRALAAALGIAGRVRHLGYLPGDTMPALYRSAAGVVFPSLFEGFGAPPLEAMACGCPVAASDAGAVAEVTGDAALRFDARDPAAIAAALDLLTSDGALRRRLREAGPAHAAGFTWAQTARRHAAAYEQARHAR